MKVKPPNRNNIKEKEQLYEDAIKLKIQLNSYREENVRLKTKIKILENDMGKQERAMEEFISKFQVNSAATQPTQGNNTMMNSPLISNSQAQTAQSQNPTSANSSQKETSNHMMSMMSAVSRPLL